MRARLLAALALWVAAALPAHAHKGSDAYFDVQEVATSTATTRALHASLSVAVRDLDLVVAVDGNADGTVTWGEVKAVMPQLLDVFDAAAQLLPPEVADPQAECRLHWQADGLERRGDGVYVRAKADTVCPAALPVRLNYSLLREQDATHRLLVAGRLDGVDLLSTVSPLQGPVVLGNGRSAASALPTTSSSQWSALRDYFSLGLHHLLEGYDHLAFLLALVLPLQLSLWARRREGETDVRTRQDFRATWLLLLRTITAFTLGHSITLMLATFGLTEASPRWVEPAIAASIAFTALLNLRPVKWVRIDVLALLFGLVHGFGFAGLLKEAAAPGGLLPWALAGFNLGVEAGQLSAVAGWVIASQFVVGRSWYRAVVVRGGSVVLILVAGFWFWERVRLGF